MHKNWIIIKKIDEKLNKLVLIIYIQTRQTYGTRRIKDKLVQNYRILVSRRCIKNIMRDLNLSVKIKRWCRIITTDSNHNFLIAPNILNRDSYALKIYEKYVGDITYIPTSEGWLYLVTVIYLYSRKIVCWSMNDKMKVSLVNDALLLVLKLKVLF